MNGNSTQLTLEVHGTGGRRFYTVREFWDCECEFDYIQPSSKSTCSLCGATREVSPDARLREVVDHLEKRKDCSHD